MLFNNGLKLLNYNYIIKLTKTLKTKTYDASNSLDLESEKFYLKMINEVVKNNYNYLYPNKKYEGNYEKILKHDLYIVYRKDKEIVGIVNYQNLNDTSIYNNKIGIKTIFGEDKIVIEDIIKDLLDKYQKDILISTVYVEKELQYIVQNMKAHFDYGQYILVDEN